MNRYIFEVPPGIDECLAVTVESRRLDEAMQYKWGILPVKGQEDTPAWAAIHVFAALTSFMANARKIMGEDPQPGEPMDAVSEVFNAMIGSQEHMEETLKMLMFVKHSIEEVTDAK